MALPPLVSLEDFESWPGVVVASGQEDEAEAVLVAVSARVRDIAGLTWVDEEEELEDVPDAIPGIVCTVALRVWSNPDGRSQTATGPFSASWPVYGLSFTAEERTAILRAAGTNGWGGLGTISTGRGPLETPHVDPCGGVYEAIPWP